MRHKNRVLEGRIKHLELQNFHISKHHVSPPLRRENDEPSRPMFDNHHQVEMAMAISDNTSENDTGGDPRSRSFIVTIDERQPSNYRQQKKAGLNLARVQ